MEAIKSNASETGKPNKSVLVLHFLLWLDQSLNSLQKGSLTTFTDVKILKQTHDHTCQNFKTDARSHMSKF